jgi:hypothetical protein
MAKKRKLYTEGSLLDLSNEAINRLKKLSESQKINDKLVVFQDRLKFDIIS